MSAPKSDNVYVFAAQKLDAETLKRAHIVQSGENIKNERGGVQSEFGYLLKIIDPTTGEAQQSKGFLRILRTLRSYKQAQPKYHTKWIAASDLLDGISEGCELVRRYHLEHPGTPRPWGFDIKISRTAGTS